MKLYIRKDKKTKQDKLSTSYEKKGYKIGYINVFNLLYILYTYVYIYE